MALTTDAIFDAELTRTDRDPQRSDESTFAFYNRCSDPVIGLVRDQLEDWFSRYPPGRDRNSVLGQLRSGDRISWNSACWELYVHESVRRFGFAAEPHPSVEGVSSHIDFLATRGDQSVYIECVTPGLPPEEVARRNGIAQLEASLNRSGLLDHWLFLDIEACGPKPVPYGRFVRALKAWVSQRETEEGADGPAVGSSQRPEFRWEREGWRVSVGVGARGPRFRGCSDVRPLAGMTALDGDLGREKATWVVLRELLEEKASGYGRLGAPYLIAMNASDIWPDSEEAEWSVLGPYPFTPQWEHAGFFLGAGGPARPGVSGVLLGTAVQLHNAARRGPTLYENPYARYPVPESLAWPRVRLSTKRIPGVSPSELFGLPEGWPGTPFADRF
jgi:hypothetical protein